MIQIERSGSIWKYSSDITESFVHVIKDYYLRFTSRGGAKRSWTRQVMERLAVKVVVQALSKCEWLDMLSPFERRKFYEALARMYT